MDSSGCALALLIDDQFGDYTSQYIGYENNPIGDMGFAMVKSGQIYGEYWLMVKKSSKMVNMGPHSWMVYDGTSHETG